MENSTTMNLSLVIGLCIFVFSDEKAAYSIVMGLFDLVKTYVAFNVETQYVCSSGMVNP